MSENMVQYVAAASNGDTDAMAKLYSKTLKASYFLAATLSSDEQKAADITKKAYARAFCTVDKLKKPEAFEIWMKQNVAAVYKESQKFVFADAEAGTAENSPEFLAESVLENEELIDKIMQAVASLKPELKTALVLYYNNGMPVSILSKFLGVSESTGNALLGKARATVLAAAGVEASAGELSGTLPVLTRIFQRKAVETSIDNSLVRDIFIFAIDAYEASKPAVPVTESVQPEIKEETEIKTEPEAEAPQEISEEAKDEEPAVEQEEAIEEDEASEAAETPDAPEASNIISLKQRISEILDSEKLPENAEESAVETVEEKNEISDIPVTQSSDADLKNFGAISLEDESVADTKVEKPQHSKKKLDIKLNPKLIGIICAVLAVLVILGVVIGKIAGGSESGNSGSQSSSDNASTYLWSAGGFSECTEIGYLDENCAYFKSATTGKYGLMDYQGNVILQPNYDGFERCGSGRDYSGRDSYHSLVVIGNEKFEITVANGMVTIAENAHLPHSVPTESLDDTAYDERDRYFEGYAAARKDGKWGYVSQEKDKKVIPYKYDAVNELSASEAAYSDYCRPVTDGLIAVKLDGKMGVINLENDIIAPFEYDNIMPGSNGVFIANKGGIWGVILTGDAMTTFDGVNITVDILPEETTDAGEDTLGKYEVIDEDGANVRSDAGSDYDKLGELSYGDVVIGYATKAADNGNKWLKIKFNGEYGWVAMSMVEKAE